MWLDKLAGIVLVLFVSSCEQSNRNNSVNTENNQEIYNTADLENRLRLTILLEDILLSHQYSRINTCTYDVIVDESLNKEVGDWILNVKNSPFSDQFYYYIEPQVEEINLSRVVNNHDTNNKAVVSYLFFNSDSTHVALYFQFYGPELEQSVLEIYELPKRPELQFQKDK